jgi:hypothetical protein
MFVLAVAGLSSRLKSIKEVIDVSSVNEEEIFRRIALVMKLHSKVYDIISSLNKFCAFNCMCLFLQIVIFFVLGFFAIYDVFRHERPVENVLLFAGGACAYNFIVGMTQITLLYFVKIIQSCEDDICKRITEISDSLQSRKIHKRAEIALLQLRGSPLVLSGGLLIIDWHVWMTICSSILSYILICIQFDMSE